MTRMSVLCSATQRVTGRGRMTVRFKVGGRGRRTSTAGLGVEPPPGTLQPVPYMAYEISL